jgi:hypothetical protein
MPIPQCSPAALVLAMLSATLSIVSAAAQQPTSAQVAAIRSACPSDYRALCSSIPPGGKDSLACLARNLDKLSASCRQAVSAGSGTATPPAASGPATPPEPAAAPASPGATAGGAPATSAPAVASPAPPLLSPREELVLIRFSCGPDVRALCAGTPPGGGRIVACLSSNRSSLSSRCVRALTSLQQ